MIYLICVLGSFSFVQAQNLAPNPSFEVYTECPHSINFGEPLQAVPWQSASLATVDYFNACNNDESGSVGVPSNFIGYQNAHSGVAYLGFSTRIQGGNDEYREYPMVLLDEPLIGGLTYHVSFYVSLADETCGTMNLGAYFSVVPPPVTNNWSILVVPQVESELGFVSDTQDWVLIQDCFVALGGEQYMTIGNFYEYSQSPVDPDCALGSGTSYYYIDDVTVIPAVNINEQLELGPPVSVCTSHTIESNIADASYFWSTGETTPSITVTTSGTYSLTVTGTCDPNDIQVDFVNVIILGTPDPVQLPEEEVEICTGDVYFISLDPGAGNYLWQDGSTFPQYNISTSGLYEVSLDDGCDITTDAINVLVVVPPPPFDLGQETELCDGDEINFNFDPTLGDFLWQDGGTAADYTISGTGTYSLTISNMCGSEEATLDVVYIDPPFVDFADDDMDLCAGETLSISLDPDIGDYEWQDGSTNSVYEITDAGFYAVTCTNICGVSTDQFSVTIINLPIFDLGDNIALCPAQLPVLLSVGNVPNATDYLWEDGSTDTTYLVVEEGTYSITVSNSCFDVVDEIAIYVEDNAPDVSLPADSIVCSGDTVILSLSGVDGEISWQDGSTEETFLVTAAGIYFAEVSNVCGVASDTVVISYITPSASPDLGPDITLCPGQSIVLSPGIQGVTYLWSDMSTADSLLIDTAGIFFVQTSNQCGNATDTIIIGINDTPPQVDLPAQLTLCQGQSITLDATVSGVTYLWNDNSQNQQLTVNAPGIYSVTVSNACGSDADTVIIADGGPAPFVFIGNDLNICAGDLTTLFPVSSNVDTWLWQDGSTLPSFNVSTAGQITVEVSNTCGISHDTLIVNLLPGTPPLNLGADTALCSGESFVLSVNTPGVSILWPDGSNGNNFTVSNSGTVVASISNTCGTSSDTILVNALPDIPVLNLGADQSLCPGELITFSPGIANVQYVWQDGSTNNTYQSTQEETVILTISNSCGTSADTVEILESTQGPQVNLGPDIQVCAGQIVTIPSGISGVNYLWQDGSSSPDFVTSVSGTFILNVSNNCGNDADTIAVDISGVPPSPALGPDTTLCEGINLILTSTADAITSIQWQDGSSTPGFIVSSPGTFILSESNRCGDAADTIVVDYLDAPDPFSLGPDTTLCPGESITLIAPSIIYDILWQDGSSLSSLIADQPATYSLQLSNDCGTVSDQFVLSYDTRIPQLNPDASIPWCEGDVFTLDATQPFDATYSWSTGSISPSIQVDAPGLYSIDVSTPCSSASQNIDVVPGTDCVVPEVHNNIAIPNVFSPNGDGINDLFYVSFGADLQVTAMTGSIYDRWGNLVFSSASNPFSWDGQFAGEYLLPGVYVYAIKVKYLDRGAERERNFAGDITLVR